MAKALVTGANGHLGCNLVRDLVEHGYEVVPMVREGANTVGLDVLGLAYARGDVRDAASVEAAMKGCDIVFHAGSPYTTWAKDPNEIIEPAVRGVETVLAAAKKTGVRRVVVTSSSNAVGFSKDTSKPLDEKSWNDCTKSPYIRAKNEQEKRAWALAKELGLDVVAVLPTGVLGRFDYKKTPTTAPFVDAFAHKGPVPFPVNVVDVRDVARAHVLAAEKGEPGERYLAGADNADVKTLADIIEKHTGRRPAEGLPPVWILRTVAFFAEIVSGMSGKAPMITNDLLDDAAGSAPVFDCTKAREKLGLQARAPEEVLVDALRWAVFMGWLPNLGEAWRAKLPPEASWKK